MRTDDLDGDVEWGFPIYLDHAMGKRIVDVDGHEYVDVAVRPLPDQATSAIPSPWPTPPGVAEFNDLADVEEQLAHGDVAAISHGRRRLVITSCETAPTHYGRRPGPD